VTRTDVAVLGLGAMGLPMAQRLAEGLRVRAYDVDDHRVAQAHSAGLVVAATPTEAVGDARAVLLTVRTAEQAETVLFGEYGAAPALVDDAVIILSSTVGIDAVQRLAQRLPRAGAELVDAPVSGGPQRARDGDLLVFVGGQPGTIAVAGPVLSQLASTIAEVGPRAGDGQAMKTVNQLLCGVNIAAAAEALALAQGLGLDPAATLEILGMGAAASFMLDHRGPRIAAALAGEPIEVLSRVDLFVKDMGLVSAASRVAGVATPVAAAAEQLYRQAEIAGHAAEDDASIVRLVSRPA
jgi:3-hydroxyisobutyrate dehydrogenase